MKEKSIRIGCRLASKRQVLQLSKLLKCTTVKAIGCLTVLWCWAEEEAEGDDIEGLTVDAVDERVGLKGFAAALEQVGWLEQTLDGFRLPGFSKYQGHRKCKCKDDQPVPIPEELRDLELYVIDANLCRKWPSLLEAWKVAFPGLDVIAEVRKAHAWELAHLSRRKTDRPGYLNGWLNRAQNRGRSERPKFHAQWGKLEGF